MGLTRCYKTEVFFTFIMGIRMNLPAVVIPVQVHVVTHWYVYYCRRANPAVAKLDDLNNNH